MYFVWLSCFKVPYICLLHFELSLYCHPCYEVPCNVPCFKACSVSPLSYCILLVHCSAIHLCKDKTVCLLVMVKIDHYRKQQCFSHQQPMGAFMHLSAASLFLVKAGWRVRVDKAVSQQHRYYQRQVAVSHTSLGWRCEVLMTHCVQDPPPQKDLRTMQRNSSSKLVAPRRSSELMTLNAEKKQKNNGAAMTRLCWVL